MTRTIRTLGVLVAAAALLAGCTVKKQETPPLSGPSVLATSLTLTANPDTLRQDGASQSQIVVLALDANSQPVRNLPVRVEVAIGGVIADFGQVSAKNVVTGSDGRASVVYTSPNASVDPVDTGTIVQILVTPTGTDYGNATTRTVNIRLVPPGIILPPNGVPVARFTFAPTAPITKSDVTFDASLSTDSDGAIASYAWNFGDGTTGSGVSVRHQYQQGGSYSVTLNVTDDRGTSGTTTQTVAVAEGANPTASFVFTPTNPRPKEDVSFNASASRAATGRSIVSYDWDFGWGRAASGVNVGTSYEAPGTYNVTLVVTDDVGNKGTSSLAVTVQSAALSAAFTFSPMSPAPKQNVSFDASTSAAGFGRSITSYSWNMGDKTTKSGRVVNHTYAADGTYVVVLSIQDDIGQVASTSQSVTVSSGAIVAGFTYSPTEPVHGSAVNFNGGDSSSPFGLSNYEWEFGDGTAKVSGATLVVTSHTFAAAGKYVVRLTVTDKMGRKATTTQTITVT